MRYCVSVVCTALLVSVAICSYCYCQTDDKYIPLALTYSERGYIVVLPANKSRVEVAPGEYVAFAGTEHYTTQWKWDPSSQKWDMEVKGDGLGRAVIARTARWGVQTKKPRTWPLMGVCALKEGRHRVTLAAKEGKKKRTITITVKKHPEDWQTKLLARLKGKKVSVKFKDATFEEVAQTLSRKTRLPFVSDYFSPEAKEKKITYSTTGESVLKVLENSLKKAGLDWVLTNNRVLLTKEVVAATVRVGRMIDSSLDWLAKHQSVDGSFSGTGFVNNCRGTLKCTGPGGADRDVALTAFAMLAFMGRGHTHRHGEYKNNVEMAKTCLLRQQKDDGSFGEMKGELSMLDSIIAASALCELQAISRDKAIKDQTQKAADFLVKSQNKDGGWAWGRWEGRSNAIATGFAVLALKAAKTGNLNVPEETYNAAAKFLKSLTDESGRAGYQKKGDKAQAIGKDGDLPASTAASVIASIFCRVKREEPGIKNGVELILKNMPDKKSIDPVYWYFATYSAFQFGKEPWKKWRNWIAGVLVQSQEKKGCAAGSFQPSGRWKKFGGRMFFTALNTLSAERVFRYLRAQEILKYEGE